MERNKSIRIFYVSGSVTGNPNTFYGSTKKMKVSDGGCRKLKYRKYDVAGVDI